MSALSLNLMRKKIMEIGKTNRLKVTRTDHSGFYLADDEANEVFLPNEYLSKKPEIEEELDVFIYHDKSNKLVATTFMPKVQLEEFAYLQVKEVNKIGAFIDWGLEKDLLVPFAFQHEKMEANEFYIVYVLKDERTNRLIGTTKIDHYFIDKDIALEIGDEVDLLLMNKTDLGMKAIVNNRYSGLIFNSDLFKNVRTGDCLKGYVKQVREDGKIDLLLEPLGYRNSIDINTNMVLSALKNNDGFLNLNDNSDPELIKQQVGLSKKAFKRSLGHLYKLNRIEMTPTGVRLI